MSKGIWLFGLSGSGKTFLSKKLAKKINKSFIIYGDIVCSLTSFNLSYRLHYRVKQNKRVLGLAKIVIKNGYFPIISSVYLDEKIYNDVRRNKIRVFNIINDSSYKINSILFKKRNIVGKTIKYFIYLFGNIFCYFVNKFFFNYKFYSIRD